MRKEERRKKKEERGKRKEKRESRELTTLNNEDDNGEKAKYSKIIKKESKDVLQDIIVCIHRGVDSTSSQIISSILLCLDGLLDCLS